MQNNYIFKPALLCSLLTVSVDIINWNWNCWLLFGFCCLTLHSRFPRFLGSTVGRFWLLTYAERHTANNRSGFIKPIPASLNTPLLYISQSIHPSGLFSTLMFPLLAVRPAEVERWYQLMWGPVCNVLVKWAAGLGKSKQRVILLTILCMCAEEMVVCCFGVFLVNHRYSDSLQLKRLPIINLHSAQTRSNHLPLPSALQRPAGQLEAVSQACSVPACSSCLLALVRPYRLPFLPRLNPLYNFHQL